MDQPRGRLRECYSDCPFFRYRDDLPMPIQWHRISDCLWPLHVPACKMLKLPAFGRRRISFCRPWQTELSSLGVPQHLSWPSSAPALDSDKDGSSLQVSLRLVSKCGLKVHSIISSAAFAFCRAICLKTEKCPQGNTAGQVQLCSRIRVPTAT